MKLTQNKVINIEFENKTNKAIFIIDNVTIAPLWHHSYVIFHISVAKIEKCISLQQCIYCWKAFIKFYKIIDNWNGYISSQSGIYVLNSNINPEISKNRKSLWGWLIDLFLYKSHENKQFGKVSSKYMHFWGSYFHLLFLCFCKDLTWNHNFSSTR